MSLITDELNKKDLSESQIFDNKINNLIVEFTKASSLSEKKKYSIKLIKLKGKNLIMFSKIILKNF